MSDHTASEVFTTLKGVVTGITYHNPDNGWSVLRVQTFDNLQKPQTVIVHQTKVFAGATMEFRGGWRIHPKYGRQFKAIESVEKKPATTAALEKYLGSGLIKGVGPKTAKKIVTHFRERTLNVFEEEMSKLTEVPGIADKKLRIISEAWTKHRAIRDVMLFLQTHGVSSLFAVRIFKEYGNNSIQAVSENPYRLADDFYGIGFFSADKIALSIGLEKESNQRIVAGIKHVLSASRESGHCYLTLSQIKTQTQELLELKLEETLPAVLDEMESEKLFMSRTIRTGGGEAEKCYYSRSLYFDELYVAKRIRSAGPRLPVDQRRIVEWLNRFCSRESISLSDEQLSAVTKIAGEKFSVLTGGPGCGKTTVTFVLVRLLEAMKKRILLAAPTGRAAQRMNDVIGREAKTIHRLLGWKMGKFIKNEESPLDVDFIIVDECSMLDISISASLLRAVPEGSQILFIGDSDQLPSVGAGNVLKDIILSGSVSVFTLTQVFRQARESFIIKYAHQINRGAIPRIDSPFRNPELWKAGRDCLFIDSDEATQKQLNFIGRVKKSAGFKTSETTDVARDDKNTYEFRTDEAIAPWEPELTIPEKFLHVDVEKLLRTEGEIEELKTVLKKIHPWSSLRYRLTASDVVKKLYLEWIPKFVGKECEIQVLSPMTRGSLGTLRLNQLLQESANPADSGKGELRTGDKVLREGDRVIHRRNNYSLGVFNGDIGRIKAINNENLTCTVSFSPDNREVIYQKESIVELDLAYAITIHKSQGSEFEAIIIPVTTQHFKMLFRNLVYTGLTRAKKMAIFVGSRRALAMAVKNQDTSQRQTSLQKLL